MKQNMGTADRIIRAVVGLGILGAGYYFKSWWGFIGLIPLGTAFVAVCPAYLPFGLSTRRERAKG